MSNELWFIEINHGNYSRITILLYINYDLRWTDQNKSFGLHAQNGFVTIVTEDASQTLFTNFYWLYNGFK